MIQFHSKKIIFLFLEALFIVLPQTGFMQSYTHPATDDEFVGPFSSWVDIKTKYKLKGNGNSDESAAFQAAFNSIGNGSSTASVLFLPAGTYRINKTLTLNNKINVSFIGADPATTKIIWGGPVGGTMLQINGTAYSRFNRISYNGNSKAKIAIDQSWDGKKPLL
jgi:hypothetical protein